MDSKFNFDYEVFNTPDELPDDIQILLRQAQNQLKRSYAPYSNFHVGAALLLDNGNIHLGCNQENASYPLCICAERVALYSVGAEYDEFEIKAMVITAFNPKKKITDPCMPCGACRQVIQEFEQRQSKAIPLYMTSEGNPIIKTHGIDPLLPGSFKRNLLI